MIKLEISTDCSADLIEQVRSLASAFAPLLQVEELQPEAAEKKKKTGSARRKKAEPESPKEDVSTTSSANDSTIEPEKSTVIDLNAARESESAKEQNAAETPQVETAAVEVVENVSADALTISSAPKPEAPKYTKSQLAKAGGTLLTQNPEMLAPLQSIFSEIGIKTIMEVPENKLDFVADRLIALGAVIE